MLVREFGQRMILTVPLVPAKTAQAPHLTSHLSPALLPLLRPLTNSSRVANSADHLAVTFDSDPDVIWVVGGRLRTGNSAANLPNNHKSLTRLALHNLSLHLQWDWQAASSRRLNVSSTSNRTTDGARSHDGLFVRFKFHISTLTWEKVDAANDVNDDMVGSRGLAYVNEAGREQIVAVFGSLTGCNMLLKGK